MSAQEIQALLDAAVARGVAPGLSAAVALPDGTRWAVAAGARGLADPTPLDPAALFVIASCTKAITSVGALQLVEQGRLALDAPAAEVLPRLAELQVLTGFDAAGQPVLRAPRRAITLRHLLTHTSGLAYGFCSAQANRYLKARGLGLAEAGAFGAPLVFDPGEGWQYGTGIDVAGLMIEAAAGRPLGEQLAATVFEPLGMADTTFEPTPAQAARQVPMHFRLPDGTLKPGGLWPSAPPEMRGGGGLFSTPTDYLTFLRAVLGGGALDGRRILGPDSLRWLTENQTGDLAAGDLLTDDLSLSRDFRPLPGVEKRHTLGFMQNLPDVPGRRRAGSLAWAGLTNCYYWADPASGVAGVLFAQILPFADPQVLSVFDDLEGLAYQAARGMAAPVPGRLSTPVGAA